MTNTIGIIGAMKEEVEILKKEMTLSETKQIAHVEFFIGNLEGKEIVLVESGIGKVNATIVASLLVENFNVDILINTGVAGSLSNDLDITDIVISNYTAHHDVDATTFGYKVGQVPAMPLQYDADQSLIKAASAALKQYGKVNYHVGPVLSGDQFIDTNDKKTRILTEFPDAKAVDMESAAIAQTCYQFDTPYIILRSMSDKADGSAEINYEEFLLNACIHSSNTVKLVLRQL